VEYLLPKTKIQKYQEAVGRNLPSPERLTPSSSFGTLQKYAQSSIEGLRIITGIRKEDGAWDGALLAVQTKAKHLLADAQSKAAKVAETPKKTEAPKPKPLFSVEKKSKPAKKAAAGV